MVHIQISHLVEQAQDTVWNYLQYKLVFANTTNIEEFPFAINWMTFVSFSVTTQ